MVNVFDEIEIINELMSQYNEEIENIERYYLEMIQKTFESDIVYQNQDTCLEYISFQEYCEVASSNLKKIYHELQGEIETKITTFKHLKFIRNSKISKLLLLARLSFSEIKNIYSNSFDEIKPSRLDENILFTDGDHIYFNPEIALSLEEESTLIEFLNAKYWDEELSFYDFLNHEAQKLS